MTEPWHFTTGVDLLDHWQTLVAGLLAAAAALATIWVTRSTANQQIAAAREQADRQIAAVHEQIAADRLSVQNVRGDESVAAALEMQAALHRCRSAIEDKRRDEIWQTYTAAWDYQTKFRAAYAVARRYHPNLAAHDPPGEVDALLGRLRNVAIRVAGGQEPSKPELDKIVTDLRLVVGSFQNQLGRAAS